ncbi:hypothetical protein HS088_TW23G00659 [Tripterygium wilfordii]|uniref:Neprosin PEP catalytic domain-containing protein n=1 Tax=Tripterygium wilfordii TaxID=458696 RepID=A0A7J7BWL9_TRIWF|nr:hypothetical protein HS088_TW23G00659 [Tripterygium wilfordii]
MKKDVGGHWSLTVNGRHIGSWKRNIFHHLAGPGSIVEWGGKVCDTRRNNRHTATSMGGDRFAEAGFGIASYFKNIKVQSLNGDLKAVNQQSLLLQMKKTNCYNIIILPQIDAHGNNFYYGGPGVGPNCP